MSDQIQCVEVAVIQCQRKVIGFLFSKFRDLEMAKDEAQRGFIALAEEDCPSIKNKEAWLITVCYRNSLRTAKRESRKVHLSDQKWSTLSDLNAPSPAEATASTESHVELLALLDTLTEKQREVIRLIYLGGLKPAEVADLLNEKPNNIHALHFAALRTLRGRLKGSSN